MNMYSPRGIMYLLHYNLNSTLNSDSLYFTCYFDKSSIVLNGDSIVIPLRDDIWFSSDVTLE